MSVKQLIPVFVYGTLKKGEPNHHFFACEQNRFAKFVCNGTTVTKYPLIIATKYNIPMLLNVPGTGHNISGEIYLVNELMFEHLDGLEDYPTIYDRHIHDITGSDG